MDSCLKTKNKCFPYGGFITKIFNHFNIDLNNEVALKISEVFDAELLKSSKIGVHNDGLLFWISDIPPTVPVISVDTPSSSQLHSTADPLVLTTLTSISDKLSQVLSNQSSILNRLTSLEGHVTALEIGQENISSRLTSLETKAVSFVKTTNEEFDSLHDMFRFSGEAMERRMNRTAVQLSEEVKFVANQIHDFSSAVIPGMNRIGRTVQNHWVNMPNPVDGWPAHAWMAEYRGDDFFNMPMPTPDPIPRPRNYEVMSRVEWRQFVRHYFYYRDRAAPTPPAPFPVLD